MNKRTLIVTAASIFAVGTFATAAFADGVKCGGTNACKGQGWTDSSSTLDCGAKGGKVL
jgi:hypothetical protein